jgi:2'-hydroxyisoflavone reductase
MSLSRRVFLSATAAAVAARALAQPGDAGSKAPPKAEPKADPAPTVQKAAKPLDLLILGGTGFLGPATVDAAKARGHTVTLFNRGKRRPGMFPDLTTLLGDRDPKVGDGLKALEGDRKWDAVIDNSGYVPRIVKASADLLKDRVKQYVFVSTISVYADNDKPDADESAPLGKLADESVEEMGARFENYGPLKALCEKAAEASMPGRATVVRPGFIVGPLDPTPRFTYWPVRCARAVGDRKTILAPGEAGDPVQIIDVRDLAEFLIHLVENGTMGAFNATGPQTPLRAIDLLMACAKAAAKAAPEGAEKPDPSFVFADGEFLSQRAIGLPILVPSKGEVAAFHRRDVRKAVKAGLKFRPPEETAAATLRWYAGVSEQGKARLDQAFLSPAKEAEALAAWAARGTPGGDAPKGK